MKDDSAASPVGPAGKKTRRKVPKQATTRTIIPETNNSNRAGFISEDDPRPTGRAPATTRKIPKTITNRRVITGTNPVNSKQYQVWKETGRVDLNLPTPSGLPNGAKRTVRRTPENDFRKVALKKLKEMTRK